MGVNRKGEQLKQQLIDILNQSEIPIGMAYYILKDVLYMTERTYYSTLNSEAMNGTETEVLGTEEFESQNQTS